MSTWSIRELLSPVITRLFVYGVNPIDVEGALRTVEGTHHMNARSLERTWLAAWDEKAVRYQHSADEAKRREDRLSAAALYRLAAGCRYASFLINPASIEEKKQIYLQFASLYASSEACYERPAIRIDVPVGENVLTGTLHLPDRHPRVCAVIFTGLGSCKEELHSSARALVERGTAAFVPDMPGCGESLFSRGTICRFETLEAAFSRILDVLERREELSNTIFGSYGLCMGGGYAHRAACADARYRFCATLFMLFITHNPVERVPLWIRRGAWFDFQTGGVSPEDFLVEMAGLAEGALDCPFLFIHARHDNWMPLDVAEAFFDRARGEKHRLILEEPPVFSGQHSVTHTMPVGEQLSWVRHIAADWIGKAV